MDIDLGEGGNWKGMRILVFIGKILILGILWMVFCRISYSYMECLELREVMRIWYVGGYLLR